MTLLSKAIRTMRNHGVRILVSKSIDRGKEFIQKNIPIFSLENMYDKKFFLENLADSRPMAEYLAPLFTAEFGIRSVVDCGAATGHWVDAFQRAGVNAIGLEGSKTASDYLVCRQESMYFADLREPLDVIDYSLKQADVVLSLEVAEHIESRYAEQYVKNMLEFRPARVIMTAATPGQTGHFHLNEQPPEYWINMFQRFGYALDNNAIDRIAEFCKQGRQVVNIDPIMRNPNVTHSGVWIPPWMPKNLLVFRK